MPDGFSGIAMATAHAAGTNFGARAAMKQISPSAERNKALIFDVLNPYLPRDGTVLEIASGTGQHAAYNAEQRRDIHWQPTDIDPVSIASIAAYQAECKQSGMQIPLYFSIQEEPPQGILASYDVMVSINMIHISAWESCLRLLDHATRLLNPGGLLFMYGPFLQDGIPTAPSNLDFDRSLRDRNPAWGIRDLGVVMKEALTRGLQPIKTVAMPANNLCVMFGKRG